MVAAGNAMLVLAKRPSLAKAALTRQPPPASSSSFAIMLRRALSAPPTSKLVLGCGSNVVDKIYPLRRWPKVGMLSCMRSVRVMALSTPPPPPQQPQPLPQGVLFHHRSRFALYI